MPSTFIFKFFEELVDPFNKAVDASNGNGTVFSYLRTQIRPFRHILPVMALVGLTKAALECWIVFYAGYLIDLMIASGPTDFLSNYWFEFVAMAGVVLFARPLIVVLDHLFLDQAVGSNLQEQVRWQSYCKIMNHPIKFFKKEFAGGLANKIMQMGQSVEEGFHTAFDAIWFAFAYVVSTVIVLSSSDWRLGIPLIAWVIIYVIYVRFMTRKVLVASENWSKSRSRMSGKVVDAYANIETVKTYSHSGFEQNYALDGLKELRHNAKLFRRLMTELALGINVLNGLMIVGVLAPAIWLWTISAVTPGEVAAATALTIRLNGMTGWILFVTTRVFEHIGIIQDGLRAISANRTTPDPPIQQRHGFQLGHIRIKNVRFPFGSQHGGGLEIDQLDIPAGQKLGLVGPSGSGKSTLVRLLVGLEDPVAGHISIDGQDIRCVPRDCLINAIAVVSQDTSLLHRSIRENLVYGGEPRSEEEIVMAAKRALAHDFIKSLSDDEGRQGYDAVVGERGVMLSGGQRQRISIARALLKNAPILVLDEATSALDSEVENHVILGMKDFIKGRTVIAIAHRLSTLERMDRIAVLSDGRIVEAGTHSDLVARPASFYSQMWRRQSRPTFLL